MSVQAGIWNFNGRPVDPGVLASVSESLRQHGPDGEFSYMGGSIALLYRPFHTTAESRRETQPFVSDKGLILTWDGRLDNREQLISDLRGDLKDEPTDVAIAAAGFVQWDTDFFRRAIGDWAISIWKPESQELVLAVDYMAIRHIFYFLKQERVWWSSDLTPLVLLSGDSFHIDDDYIAGYFGHDPEGHLTPYREIREVPPGQFVRIRNNSVRVERFWKFNPGSRIRYKTDAEYEEHFCHVFRQSVRRRLRSDCPILAELSGGLDSSSIVCMADDVLAKEGGTNLRLDTLSYYDKTEPQGDDWIYFKKVEEYRKKTGYHIDASRVGSPGPPESEFNPLPGHFGSGRDLESERADVVRAGGYRVVLSGIGGDEFLGGIPNPSAQLADLIVQFRWLNLAKQLWAWSLVKRRPLTHLFWNAAMELLPSSVGRYATKQAQPEAWINQSFAEQTHLAIRLIDVDEHFGFWLPTRRSSIGLVLLMANKLAKWPSSKLQPEEPRYPYLDQQLMEFILSVPASQLLRPGDRRSLMRRSLAGLVPHEILSRRTKQFGARTPVLELQKHPDQIKSAFRSSLSSRLGYVEESRFLDELQAVRNGKGSHMVRLLRAISLEFWLRDLASRGLLANK
jgi:asparagine synthase (glutamine-hydrolysing)